MALQFGYPIELGYRPAVAHGAKFAIRPRTIRGYATVYRKPHVFEGALDVFMPGTFARTLTTLKAVRLLINHDEGNLVATSADRLKLFGDNYGLAFSLTLPGDDLGARIAADVKSGDLCGMSVSYIVKHATKEEINGVAVRVIDDAELYEISLCRKGCVEQAFAYLTADDDDLLPLHLASQNLQAEGAAIQFKSAIANLQRAISGVSA